MILKLLDDVDLADVAQLINMGASEGRTLEFKAALPGGRDDDIREFLADATSLANTDGGDLIYGVTDKDGVADAMPGVSLILPIEDTELRLENLLRDGVQPRLAGTRLKWLEISPGVGVLIVRIRASLASPHRVVFRGGAKFHHRNGRGKAEMDTHELRQAFTSSEALPGRLKELHQDAVRLVEQGDLPFSLSGLPKAVLTIAPLSVIRDARNLEVDHLTGANPPVTGGLNWIHSLEGFYRFAASKDGLSDSFALTRRTGQVDICWTIGHDRDGDQLVWPFVVERTASERINAAVAALGRLGVEGPFVISMTLVHVMGYRLCVDEWISGKPTPAWRSQLALPPLIIESTDSDALMPLARAFWYAMSEKRPEGVPLGHQG